MVENLASDCVRELHSRWRRLIQAAYLGMLQARLRPYVPSTPNAGMVRMITLLAALAAATIAAIVPVSCFLAAEARLRGEVEISAQHYASEVAEEARQNPALWNALADSSQGKHWTIWRSDVNWMQTVRALFPNGGAFSLAPR